MSHTDEPSSPKDTTSSPLPEAQANAGRGGVSKTDAPPQGISIKTAQGFWILLGILMLAFILRVSLLRYGMPLLLYEDEPIYYDHALGFGFGHWDIGYFKKPSFFLYFYGVFYYLGFMISPFIHWKDYVDAFWQNPLYVTSIGRMISVLFAVGTVYRLARLGTRVFGWAVGLTVALWLALDITHLRISPIVISDIPSLFFVVTTAWFAWDVYEKGRLKNYLLCALSITLAACFKYNIFTVFFLLSAHTLAWLKTERALENQQPASATPTQTTQSSPTFAQHLLSLTWRTLFLDTRLWLALALIPLVFLLLNPLILKDFSTFWEHLNFERKHMLLGDTHKHSAQWQFLASFHPIFFKIFPRELGWPVYIMGLLGIPWALWRYRSKAIILWSFPLVFLAVVLQFELINAKYLLPILTFWYLAAAVFLKDSLAGVAKGLQKLGMTTPPLLCGLVYVILALSATSLNAMESFQYVAVYTRAETRQTAMQRIQATVENGDRFFLEPDTLTLDNRIFRSQVVVSDYQHGHFQRVINAPTAMQHIDLKALAPRYILINFGKADKRRHTDGRTYYRMPYETAYYQYMQQHYRIKAVYAPFKIFMTLPEMQHELDDNGFPSLYKQIQHHKTQRRQPGPLMLWMERRPSEEVSQHASS